MILKRYRTSAVSSNSKHLECSSITCFEGWLQVFISSPEILLIRGVKMLSLDFEETNILVTVESLGGLIATSKQLNQHSKVCSP